MTNDAAELLLSLVPALGDRCKYTSQFIMICCPFHGGGNERTPSCSVRRDMPVWFCHGCQTGGHISRILSAFGISQKTAQVALDGLQLDSSMVRRNHNKSSRTVYGNNPYRCKFLLDDADTLSVYRYIKPVQLLKDGFTEETLDFFEVGWDASSLRITYPIRNIYGELIGISGRTIIKDLDPKYRIYGRELVERKELGLPDTYTMDGAKKVTLWNFHNVFASLVEEDKPQPLVLTEGFKACMWVRQSHYQTVSALIGSYLTDFHAELLARICAPVILFLDNNAAGKSGTEKAALILHRHGVPFTIARYPDEREQPDHLEPEELTDALTDALTYSDWRYAA